jgi:hypothetical protein
MIASLQEKKPQVPPQRFALSQNKLQLLDFKWVTQVSLLRPGFLLANGSSPEHPGLKIETWATHLIFVRGIVIFLGGPQAHVSSGMNAPAFQAAKNSLVG